MKKVYNVKVTATIQMGNGYEINVPIDFPIVSCDEDLKVDVFLAEKDAALGFSCDEVVTPLIKVEDESRR